MEKQERIFGIRVVIEAINAGKTIDKVFIQKNAAGVQLKKLEYLIRNNHINCSYVPIEKLNHLVKENHQGVIANVSPVRFYDLEKIIEEQKDNPNALFLLLDGITDTRNLGGIIRTAECTGVDAIILPVKGNASITADTIKTSSGAVFKVSICKVDHLKDAVFLLKSFDIDIISSTEKSPNTVYSIDFKKPCAIVIGSEERGITPSILRLSTQTAKIPLYGSIASLNVSVASSIMLYELIRQRNFSV